MELRLTAEQELLRDSFAQLFAAESSCARVRAAEPLGFDPALWRRLAEAGALGMRVPEAAGGGGSSLLDAAIVAEQAGRRLASGPLLETVVGAALLAGCDAPEPRRWLERQLAGEAVVSLALRDVAEAGAQLVAGGAVADAVIALDGDALLLVVRPPGAGPARCENLGSSPLAAWDLSAGQRLLLARGAAARRAHQAACEEWKLLCAAGLTGLAREALEMAGRYSGERVQFDRPIGSFQGIAHPLAESVADVEGAHWLLWRAIAAVAGRESEAAARVSTGFFWASRAASRAVARALHTFGGYGLSLEYDIQLYHRRGKAWPLVAGDPRDELLRGADRLWRGEAVPLPDAGEVQLDWGLGPEALAFAQHARRFLAENLTEELRAHAHFSWEGHHPEFQRALARAGLLYPSWPKRHGGQERGPYEMAALWDAFREAGWSRTAIATTGMVGATLMRFGSPELQDEVLPRIGRGEAICSLGYTEPGSGSDVAAAVTRAVPDADGEGWVIDGQKMFTSGADLAQYVFLLCRTDTQARKHRGLTLFLVPLDTPGIEVQAVHTLSDERTNITYYQGVRVPDRYRVGEVDHGWTVLAYALDLEHGGTFAPEQRDMVEAALDFSRRTQRGGRPLLEDPRTRERLARAWLHAEIASLLGSWSLFARAEGIRAPAAGPISKFFSSDHFILDAADLLDLCAPDSLVRGEGPGAVEFAYRLSTATSIYGGTSEIMKSIVAQVSLGMPRSRS